MEKVYYESYSRGKKTEYTPISDFVNPNVSLSEIRNGCFKHKYNLCNHVCSDLLMINDKSLSEGDMEGNTGHVVQGYPKQAKAVHCPGPGRQSGR